MVRMRYEIRSALRATPSDATCYRETMKRRVCIVTSHDEARRADYKAWAAMTKEERLAIGAELHAFWVRNFHKDARRLDRTLRIVQRP